MQFVEGNRCNGFYFPPPPAESEQQQKARLTWDDFHRRREEEGRGEDAGDVAMIDGKSWMCLYVENDVGWLGGDLGNPQRRGIVGSDGDLCQSFAKRKRL
jgi:hypothetical protein